MTEMTEGTERMQPLGPAAEKFVLHWGEMGTRWGVNRTVAQIHALLYISSRPLNAEEIAETLNVARSNVSTSLRELQRWGIVRATHVLGDRRDYFESPRDTWEMIKLILEERKRREIDPTLQVLEDCLAESETSSKADPRVRERLQSMLGLFQTMDSWYREIMSLPGPEVKRLMRMSRQVRKILSFRSRGKR
jgi:DNA-binding transcriptional regulator GbsR (MarR family)